MPRAKRRIDVPVFDPVHNAIEEMRARSGHIPNPKRQEKLRRRLEKARVLWDGMTPTERLEWCETYLREQRQRSMAATLPKRESERRDMFAIVHIAERQNRRDAAEYQATVAAREAQEARRRAAAAERQAAEPAPAFVEPLPSPEPAEPTATDRGKKRSGRRGHRVGVVAIRMPDGTMRAPIYDEDDY